MLTNPIPSYLNPPKTKLCLVDGGRETKRTEGARVVESVCTKQLNERNAEAVRKGGKKDSKGLVIQWLTCCLLGILLTLLISGGRARAGDRPRL